jgi:hypothetical protein
MDNQDSGDNEHGEQRTAVTLGAKDKAGLFFEV